MLNLLKANTFNTNRTSGHSSVVERLVANEKVEGSSPFARSKLKLKIMNDLANKKCVPCEGGIPAFDIKEIHKYLKKIDGWDVIEDKEKIFTLKKILSLRTTLKVKILSSMSVKLQRKKDTTPI